MWIVCAEIRWYKRVGSNPTLLLYWLMFWFYRNICSDYSSTLPWVIINLSTGLGRGEYMRTEDKTKTNEDTNNPIFEISSYQRNSPIKNVTPPIKPSESQKDNKNKRW